MAKTHYVTCPFCEGMMEVSAESGEIVEKWSAKDKSLPGTDKMSSALKKLEQDKKKRETLFDKKKEAIEDQKRKIDSVFQKEVEKIKKEGIKENPIRPFDLD